MAENVEAIQIGGLYVSRITGIGLAMVCIF
jgi:hypothetical protein